MKKSELGGKENKISLTIIFLKYRRPITVQQFILRAGLFLH